MKGFKGNNKNWTDGTLSRLSNVISVTSTGHGCYEDRTLGGPKMPRRCKYYVYYLLEGVFY